MRTGAPAPPLTLNPSQHYPHCMNPPHHTFTLLTPPSGSAPRLHCLVPARSAQRRAMSVSVAVTGWPLLTSRKLSWLSCSTNPRMQGRMNLGEMVLEWQGREVGGPSKRVVSIGCEVSRVEGSMGHQHSKNLCECHVWHGLIRVKQLWNSGRRLCWLLLLTCARPRSAGGGQ